MSLHRYFNLVRRKACPVTTLTLALLWYANAGIAASIRPTAVSGVMQQPTSQYYHLAYGVQLDLARLDDAALMRWQYLERPAFHKSGYIDQDFSGAFFIGANVLKQRQVGVNALIGGGYAWGYLKEDGEGVLRHESYRLPGVATALEARWTTPSFDVRVTHQVMICQNSQAQTEAYVAWPFSWTLLSVSAPINFGG